MSSRWIKQSQKITFEGQQGKAIVWVYDRMSLSPFPKSSLYRGHQRTTEHPRQESFVLHQGGNPDEGSHFQLLT